MSRILQPFIFLVITTLTLQSEVTEPDLPLCPTNVQYFPQELPMHCRMPRSPKNEGAQTSMPLPPFPSFPQPPGPGNTLPPWFPQPPNQWNDKPPQFPPIPPGYNVPGAVFPGPPPGAIPMPMPMPMPMPIGMPPPPSAKLPVIVMPFYSPDKNYRKDEKPKREKDRYPSSSDTEDCSDTDDTDSDKNEYWKGVSERRSSKRSKHHRRHRGRGRGWSGRRANFDGREGRELLTPIIQYVTRDGYVIYEKEISKGEAKDWLNIKTKDETDRRLTDVEDLANQEQLEQEVEDNMLNDKRKEMMERNPAIMLSQKPVPPRHHRKKKTVPQQKPTHNS